MLPKRFIDKIFYYLYKLSNILWYTKSTKRKGLFSDILETFFSIIFPKLMLYVLTGGKRWRRKSKSLISR